MAGLVDLGRMLATNPNWIRADAALTGEDPNLVYARALQAQTLQAQLEEQQHQKQQQEALQELFARMRGNLTPEFAFEAMKSDPKFGLELLESARKTQAEQRRQQFLGQILGTGEQPGNNGATTNTAGLNAPDTTKLAAYGTLTGDPSMTALATFLQGQNNRKEDAQRDLEKEARQEKMEIDKTRRESQIPGYELSGDAAPTSTNITKAQDLAAAIPAYKEAVKSIKNIIKKRGSTTGWGTDVAESKQALNTLLNLERTLNQTGALNIGELPILEEAYETFNPTMKTNLLKSRAEMEQAAEDYLNNRVGMINEKLKGFGYKAKGGATPSRPSDVPEELWNEMTPEERAQWP